MRSLHVQDTCSLFCFRMRPPLECNECPLKQPYTCGECGHFNIVFHSIMINAVRSAWERYTLVYALKLSLCSAYVNATSCKPARAFTRSFRQECSAGLGPREEMSKWCKTTNRHISGLCITTKAEANSEGGVFDQMLSRIAAIYTPLQVDGNSFLLCLYWYRDRRRVAEPVDRYRRCCQSRKKS